MVAARAMVLIGGVRWPGTGRTIGRLGGEEALKSVRVTEHETCGRSIDEGSSDSADGDIAEVGEECLRHDVRSCIECQYPLQ